jgi:CRISPR-associated endonuclease/helicase Cas3
MNFLDTKTIPLDSFKLLSHPNTKLIIHLNDVTKKATQKIKDLNVNERVKKAVYFSALFHDFGKASSYFQEKLKYGKNSKYANHSLISALAGYFYTNDPFVFLAIKYHHSNLENCERMCIAENKDYLLEIAKNIDREIEEIYNSFRIDFSLDRFIEFIEKSFDDFGFELFIDDEDFFDFLIVFSALIYADKESAIFKGNKKEVEVNFRADFVDNYKKRFIKQKYEIDFIREKIYKTSTQIDKNRDIFFMELPTGAGKTFALINIALQFNRKIFYLLPFITLIEQNAKIFKDILEFNGINVNDNRIFYEKHSLSGEFKVDKTDEYDLDKKEFLSDSFDSKVIVTTFIQFFYSFFKSRNSFLKRAINVANSVIIIDEIQAVKEELLFVIEELFNFLIERFNCKIVIATATMPPLKVKNSFYIKKIEEFLDKKELAFFDRYDVNLDIKEYDEETILEFIDEKLSLKKDLLFRVNTINSANYIAEYLDDAILLTSALPPILRQKRIKKIKEKGGVIVATQVIQAGVDISLEDGFEELAPLDMIIQSMGRRNRSAEKSRGYADLIRFNFKGFDGSRVYNQGLIKRTLRLIKDKKIVSESELREILKEFYKGARKKDFIRYMQDFNFETIDKEFELIENSKSVQFFCVIDKKSQNLWDKLLILDDKRKKIKGNFWEEKRKIEEEFNKIKKDVFLYTATARIYDPKKEYKIANEFEKAFFIYKADDRIFDYEKGVNIKEFLKEENIFW